MTGEPYQLEVQHVLERIIIIFQIKLLELVLHKQHHYAGSHIAFNLSLRSAIFDRVRLNAVFEIDH